MTFQLDPILEYIGWKGKWQYLHSFGLFLFALASGISAVSFAFTGYIPKYRCAIPICGESEIKSPNYFNGIINQTYLMNEKYGINEQSCKRLVPSEATYQNCEEYLELFLKITSSENNENDTALIESCNQKDLVFDRSVVFSTITEDFGFVCSDSYVRDLMNAIFMIGTSIGAALLGIISDNFGRLKAAAFSLTCMSIPGIVCTLWINKYFYGIYRVLAGIGYRGGIMIAMIIASETSHPKYKVFFIFIASMGLHFGELLAAAESYLIRDWKTLHIVFYAPVLVFLILCFVIPEPARWLLSKGNDKKAKEILQKIAKFNNKYPIPEDLFASPNAVNSSKPKFQSLSFWESLKAIIKSKILLLRSLNMMYQWFCVLMVYMGTLYIGTKLSGNPHLNLALTMIPAIPGNFVFLYLPDRLGRRNTLTLTQTILGICCITAGFLGGIENLLIFQIIISMTIRFFAGVSVKTAQTMTVELFPTPVRSTAVGIGAMIGGLGGCFGLFIETLSMVWRPLPLIIIGGLTILGSILCFIFLPETKDDTLPDTIEDALDLGKKPNKFSCCLCMNNRVKPS